jgi:hypothetical protein
LYVKTLRSDGAGLVDAERIGLYDWRLPGPDEDPRSRERVGARGVSRLTGGVIGIEDLPNRGFRRNEKNRIRLTDDPWHSVRARHDGSEPPCDGMHVRVGRSGNSIVGIAPICDMNNL